MRGLKLFALSIPILGWLICWALNLHAMTPHYIIGYLCGNFAAFLMMAIAETEAEPAVIERTEEGP